MENIHYKLSVHLKNGSLIGRVGNLTSTTIMKNMSIRDRSDIYDALIKTICCNHHLWRSR